MKLVIERGNCCGRWATSPASSNGARQSPSCRTCFLKANNGELHLKATDLEREVIEQIAANVVQPGAVTVPAHRAA